MLIKYLIDKLCVIWSDGGQSLRCYQPILSSSESVLWLVSTHNTSLSLVITHHRRVSSQEWWRDHIGAPNTHTGHQPSVDVSRAEKHPGNVTSSQSTTWLESKQFSSTLICSDQNFCPGRRHGTRNSKALGGNVFSEFYNLPAFADLRCCPELDTQVFHCPHGQHMTQANRLPRHQNKPICQNFHSNYEL